MADTATITNGVTERFRTQPWNGTGVDVSGLKTSRQAIKAAHMNWQVEKQDTYYLAGDDLKIVPHRYALVRQDTKAILGNVGEIYQVLQNVEAFDFFDKIVGEGRAVYDAAGTMFGGKKIWITAKLNPEDFRKSSEPRSHHVILTNAFGGASIFMRSMIMQLYCTNQLAAIQAGKTNVFRIPHFGDMHGKVEQAREGLNILTDDTRELEKCLEEIRRLKMSEKQAETVAGMLADTDYARDSLTYLFKEGIGCEGKTRYDMLNAVTQFTTHHTRARGNEQLQGERRLNSVWNGKANEMQRRALSLLLE